MVQDLFRSKNFSVTSVLPRTNYPNNNFSFVTAYSVFSHLSESASSVWIEEFARIIKPDGLLALTTRHETFFDFLQGLQRKRFGLFRRKGYLKAFAELFPNMHKARKDYRNGQFVFATSRGVSGGGSMNETFYGQAFIPKQYVQTHYCHYFDLVDSKFDSSRYDQQLFILQRNKCSLDVCQLKHVTPCAAEFSVSPLIHPEDFIFKFLIENPSFKSTQAAIRYYFSTGRE